MTYLPIASNRWLSRKTIRSCIYNIVNDLPIGGTRMAFPKVSFVSFVGTTELSRKTVIFLVKEKKGTRKER